MNEQKRPYPRRRRRRINLHIKRKMQLRMLVKIFAIILLCCLISSIVFYVFSNKQISGDNFGQIYRAHRDASYNFMEMLLWVVLLAGGISMVVGIVLALFFPHCIAGPLFRIERELENVGKGDLTVALSLRKGDENKDLAEVITQMVKGLNGSISKIKAISDEINGLVASEQIDAVSAGKLKDLSSQLQETVGLFKLEKEAVEIEGEGQEGGQIARRKD